MQIMKLKETENKMTNEQNTQDVKREKRTITLKVISSEALSKSDLASYVSQYERAGGDRKDLPPEGTQAKGLHISGNGPLTDMTRVFSYSSPYSYIDQQVLSRQTSEFGTEVRDTYATSRENLSDTEITVKDTEEIPPYLLEAFETGLGRTLLGDK